MSKNILTDGIFNEIARFKKFLTYNHSYVAQSNGGGGKSGYFKAITIKIIGTYMNAPIRFEYNSRSGHRPTNIYIRFNSVNGTDPTLASFYRDGPKDAFIHKSGVSTWDVYISKSETYDSGTILDARLGSYGANRLEITYPNEWVETVPDGFINATDATVLNRSNIADYAFIQGMGSVNANANNINTSGFYRVYENATNVPGTNGVLIVFASGSSTGVTVQIYVHYEGSTHIRINWYGTWHSWKVLA